MTSHWASKSFIACTPTYPYSSHSLSHFLSLHLLHDSCLLLVIISSNLKLKKYVQELFQYAVDADTYCLHLYNSTYMRDLVVVQSINCIQLFATPWTAAHQASLSFTLSRSLLKLMSIELMMPSNHLILGHPLLLLPSIFPSIMAFSSESALYIRQPNSQIHSQKVHWWLPGSSWGVGRGTGSWCLTRTEFQFRKERNSADGWKWELLKSVNALGATSLYS